MPTRIVFDDGLEITVHDVGGRRRPRRPPTTTPTPSGCGGTAKDRPLYVNWDRTCGVGEAARAQLGVGLPLACR